MSAAFVKDDENLALKVMADLMQQAALPQCFITAVENSAGMDVYRVEYANQIFIDASQYDLRKGKILTAENRALPVAWYHAFRRVLASGVMERFDCWGRLHERCLQVQIALIRMEGEKTAISVTVQDVTCERRELEALLEVNRRYRDIFDALPMPLWVLGKDGKKLFLNTGFGNFFGCGTAQQDMLRWESLLHQDDLPTFRYDLEYALRERGSFTSLIRARRSDGQWRWLEMNAVPLWSVQGGFEGLAGSSRDVTDRRLLEEDNEQLLRSERAARSAAESTSRLKDEFLATISHELRTPLTTVLGWSELLLQRTHREDPAYKGLTVISTSAYALRRLISDMLDLSGMIMGKLTLSMEPLNLVDEINDAVSSVDVLIKQKHLNVVISAPEARVPILGDLTRIQQIFWNLLSNAVKFTQEGGRIDVRLWVDGAWCFVEFQDDGVGIAPEFLPHIFTRFTQADATTTRRFGGLGLGLAIVHQLVDLHGGKVQAYSQGIGHGARFVVEFPLQEYMPELSRPALSHLRAVVSGTDSDILSNVRLLLVDDQKEIHEFIRQALERHGAQVHTASSASDALYLLGISDHGRYDLVISDIGMPGMDGYALAKVIREELGLPSSTLPMLALTALTSGEDRERALSGGYQGYIAKPCKIPRMLAEIQRLLVNRFV